jgi:DNA mismatch endonuclease (patch repair protein)
LTDIVSKEKRSAMMAGIHSGDTKPEVRVRKELFAAGYRYRLHRRDLPGTPDIVMPGKRIAVFVNGCFWHGHVGCRLAAMPSTRTEFWQDKFDRNRERDRVAISALLALRWRVLTVWECFVRKTLTGSALRSSLVSWIEGQASSGELSLAGAQSRKAL